MLFLQLKEEGVHLESLKTQKNTTGYRRDIKEVIPQAERVKTQGKCFTDGKPCQSLSIKH